MINAEYFNQLEQYRHGVQCAVHHCNITKCFDKHHQPEPDIYILLPCDHTTTRPNKTNAVVKCPCGRIWNLKKAFPDTDKSAWDAQEIT